MAAVSQTENLHIKAIESIPLKASEAAANRPSPGTVPLAPAVAFAVRLRVLSRLHLLDFSASC